MQPVKFKVSELHDADWEAILLAKLRGLDGIMDVEIDSQTREVRLSLTHPQTCEGVFCSIEQLGYKVHRD